MAKEQKITCIICPLGCKIIVKIDGSKAEVATGPRCKQGIAYAQNEALDPRRILTSSILVRNGEWPLVSVKSKQPLPKHKMFISLKKIKQVIVDAPIKRGDILIKNVADTGIDIIATKTVNQRKIENGSNYF